ncbi:twin-arginine translocation signal domain-containing protein [Paraflavitalea speifideaquila]|nr:twin-arginine translocation signal domain-containing protein [Paraflavitalea speifideiaquila]
MRKDAPNQSSRRDFVKHTSLIAGGLIAAPLFPKPIIFLVLMMSLR